MSANPEQMVLTTDSAAARLTTVEGWVSRNGRFYGADERAARWDGATHVLCSECGAPTEKHWTKCDDCREKAELAKFLARERRPYVSGMIYSDARERFFDDADDLLDFAADEGIEDLDDLRLRLCDPVYPRYLDDDHWCDDLPEDSTLEDVAGDLADAVARVNDVIKQMRVDHKPLSWAPGKCALDVASLQPAQESSDVR